MYDVIFRSCIQLLPHNIIFHLVEPPHVIRINNFTSLLKKIPDLPHVLDVIQ